MSTRRNLLLLSNSTLHPTGYLEYARHIITEFLKSAGVQEILFIPYALSNQDGYADKVRSTLGEWGFKVSSIHESADPVEAVNQAQAVFVGGGNTFQLLKGLYDNNVIPALQRRVLGEGMPYIGSSAGTNVATVSINTTNDMPIVYPPSFAALALVPFNINPHYIDTDPSSTHMGETREDRILQYHEVQGTPPVLALREGSILRVEGSRASLMGNFKARLFVPGKEAQEFPPDQDFSFLL